MKRRWIALMLVMVLLLLPGCQATQATTTTAASVENDATTAAAPEETTAEIQTPEFEPATWQQKTDPVTLTIYSRITNQQDPEKTKENNPPLWGEDVVSRYIMDVTGVKLLQLKDGGQVNLDVIMASNEWADLYAAASDIDASYPLEDAAICYSLDELAAQYCPDFWDDTDPLEVLNNTASDGHIYTLRSGYYNTKIYDDPSIPVYAPYTMGINTKWLEKLEAEMPTSIEELEVLLYDMKQLGEEMGAAINPLIMGDAITSPLAGWMGVKEDVFWDEESKTVRTPLRQNAWVEYLALLNRWYKDGIVVFPKPEELNNYDSYDTEYDDQAYYMRFVEMEGWLEGKSSISFVTAFDTNRYDASISLSKATEPHEKFKWQVITKPLTWQGENRLYAQDNGAWRTRFYGRWYNRGSGLFITRQCSNPERAILFYQFLKSDEGGKLTHWGMKGVHYDANNEGKPVHKEGYRAAVEGAFPAFVRPEECRIGIQWSGIEYWDFVPNAYAENAYFAVPDGFNGFWDVVEIRKQLNEAGLAYKEAAWENKNPVLQLAQPAIGSDDHKSYEEIYHTWLVGVQQIVTEAADTVDVQERWNDLMLELKTMGLDNYEQAMTVRFADALKRYQDAGYYTDIQP